VRLGIFAPLGIIETFECVWGTILPIVGAIPPAPTILSRLKDWLLNTLCRKICILLLTKYQSWLKRELVQNCRGWGYRPDNRPILLLGHLGFVYGQLKIGAKLSVLGHALQQYPNIL
jgi:hypothetical protein